MSSVSLITHSLSDMQIMAESIARCGLFGMKTPDQALALMLVAQAEGMHPATVTQDYDIIQGKACRKSHSVMARFQQTGGKVEWHELTDKLADATFSHPSGGKLRMSWTWKQAESAKLTNKDNWRNYPRAMLRARLIAEAVRAVYPAALGGMLMAEEAQDLPYESMHSTAAKVSNPEYPHASQEADALVDPQPFISEALMTTTDADALACWKAHNGKLTKQPTDHAAFKQAVADHRAALREATITDIEPKEPSHEAIDV